MKLKPKLSKSSHLKNSDNKEQLSQLALKSEKENCVPSSHPHETKWIDWQLFIPWRCGRKKERPGWL